MTKITLLDGNLKMHDIEIEMHSAQVLFDETGKCYVMHGFPMENGRQVFIETRSAHFKRHYAFKIADQGANNSETEANSGV